jgi:hypothetical protein
MSTIPKRKHKCSDIEANYRNKTKTFWFGPHTIGTKAKHFDLVQNNFYCKQIVSVLAQKFWDKAKQFDLVCLLSEQKQNILIWSKNVLIASKSFLFGPKILVRRKAIWFGLEIVLGKIERFFIIQKLTDRKQNFLIWFTYYRNESKTFWFGPLIIGTKAKQFDLLRKLSQLYNLTPLKRFSMT